MMYVSESGAITRASSIVVASLMQSSSENCIEDALIELGYHPSVHIGREHIAELEIHLNENRDAEFAAIGFVTLGENYETYVIETRHAALLFAKEFAPTIRDICELGYAEGAL